MNQYNPNIHHRRSIRLKGYDYSQKGLYFITICVQNRECLFGDIKDGQMILNDAGKMIEKWYYALESKYQDIKCHEMIVMPNHFHCIIENTGIEKPVGSIQRDRQPVGAIQRDCQTVGAIQRDCRDINEGQSQRIATTSGISGGIPDKIAPTRGISEGIPEKIAPTRGISEGIPEDINPTEEISAEEFPKEITPTGIYRVVQWFKTMTTNEYIRGVKSLGWQSFNGKLWQRNYYEHIIRNNQSYENITEYIIKNPAKWANDKFCDKIKD